MRPRREPGQRGERARHTRAHDRGLPADREHVAADRRQRRRSRPTSRDADEPREQERAARDQRDVLARDGEQVVEARRAKPRARAPRDSPSSSPRTMPGDHRTALAVRGRAPSNARAGPQPIGEAGDPAAVADDAPVRRRARRRARRGGAARCARRSRSPARAEARISPMSVENRALRRRAAGRKPERAPAREARGRGSGAPRPARAGRTATAAPAR